MHGTMHILQEKLKLYEAWVTKNPSIVNEFEAASKWLSFFLVSRVSDSRIASEFVYSASNLLVLYHDRILSRAQKQNLKNDKNIGIGSNNNKNLLSIENLKILLTTLEHCEVFIELSVQRFSGVRAKWLTVTFLQLLTCTGRLLLLRHSQEKIIIMPPIPFVNRKELNISTTNKTTSENTLPCETSTHGRETHNNFSIKLKRSGRIVRKVEGAPPLQFRDSNIFNSYSNSSSNTINSINPNICTANKKLLNAEYVYISKPLVHLAAMYMAGNTSSWMPYYISMGLDLASLRIIYANRQQLSKEQRLELSRRVIRLGLYLMRSPFYELHTKARLQLVFRILGNIPLLRLITNAIREYLPLWQKTYFLTWNV